MEIKKMLNDNILVKIIKEESKTEGGVILLTPNKTYQSVMIEAVPDDIKFVASGDIVYISRHAGVELDKERLIINSKEIILKL